MSLILLFAAPFIVVACQDICQRKNIKECKQRCSSFNEDYSNYFYNDEDKLICYCKPKLNIVNGIVR
jgi:hypothetical protein